MVLPPRPELGREQLDRIAGGVEGSGGAEGYW